jgi:hypothetical protein
MARRTLLGLDGDRAMYMDFWAIVASVAWTLMLFGGLFYVAFGN